MRVALVAEQLRRPFPGGIGTYALQLARALAARSTGVELVASRAARPLGATSADPLRTVAPVTETRFPHEITSRLWHRDLLRLDARVARCADVVHATSFHYPAPAETADPSARPMLTVFVHDLAWRSNPEHFSARGAAFHDAALARSIRRADRLFVPSARTADALVEAGAASSRVRIVDEGCDHLPPPTPGVGVDHDRPYVLTVSTIEPRKNLGAVLRAFEDAAQRCTAQGRPRPRLVVVGASGWPSRTPALPDALPSGVELLGPVDDQRLSDLFAGASAFVYLPVLEGFGLPPLEAMRAGVPCVVSKAVPSVVEHGDPAAVLVDPFDVDAASEALARLLSDDECRAEWSARGRSATANRTWAASAEAHLAAWS